MPGSIWHNGCVFIAVVTCFLHTTALFPADLPTDPAEEAHGMLSISADQADTLITVDGVAVGSTPLEIPHLAPGKHLVTVTAKDLPSFAIPLDIFSAEKTTVSVRLAVQRVPADYAEKKRAYEDASASIGVKTAGGLGCCGVGVPAMITGVVLPFVNVVNDAVALSAIAGGCALSLAGAGLCGWALLGAADAPDEPFIQRIHLVKVTPPPGRGEPQDLEIFAPPLDTDGKAHTPPAGPAKKNADGKDGVLDVSDSVLYELNTCVLF